MRGRKKENRENKEEKEIRLSVVHVGVIHVALMDMQELDTCLVPIGQSMDFLKI